MWKLLVAKRISHGCLALACFKLNLLLVEVSQLETGTGSSRLKQAGGLEVPRMPRSRVQRRVRKEQIGGAPARGVLSVALHLCMELQACQKKLLSTRPIDVDGDMQEHKSAGSWFHIPILRCRLTSDQPWHQKGAWKRIGWPGLCSLRGSSE